MLELSTPVQYVKGVGPRIGEILAAKGIHTVGDLLHYLPFRYEDRLNPRGISELRAGEMATVVGEVRNSGLFRTRSMPIFQLTVGQGRARLRCLLFQRDLPAGQVHARADDRACTARSKKTSAAASCRSFSRSLRFWATPPTLENGAEKKAAESLEIGRIVPIYEAIGTSDSALVSAGDPHGARQSDARLAGSDSGRRARASGADLAARRPVERALAGAGGKLRRTCNRSALRRTSG